MIDDPLLRQVIGENFRLATEVDLLTADLKYLKSVMGLMSKLLGEHDVPVPSDDLDKLEADHADRIQRITNMAKVIEEIQGLAFGMRTGDKTEKPTKSPGMRTGEVTAEDVNRVLGDLDPDIVKRMGE